MTAPAVVQPPVVQPPVVQPPSVKPRAKVKVRAVDGRSALHVNVDPNLRSGSWEFQVQRRVDGRWKLVDVFRTHGSRETRTLDLPKGR